MTFFLRLYWAVAMGRRGDWQKVTREQAVGGSSRAANAPAPPGPEVRAEAESATDRQKRLSHSRSSFYGL
jgi:hypothetical protein